MAPTYRWTVDVEVDEGGRTQGDKGIKEGLPIILEGFKKYHIKGLFFISTELLPKYYDDIKYIKEEGHEIGSHGHFHIIYKEAWRTQADKEFSENILASLNLTPPGFTLYRAPKFNREFDGQPYSARHSHVSLLRNVWTKEEIKRNTIIYLHPFDLVDAYNPVNMFCRLWYSRPKDAREVFNRLLSQYPHTYIR